MHPSRAPLVSRVDRGMHANHEWMGYEVWQARWMCFQKTQKQGINRDITCVYQFHMR